MQECVPTLSSMEYGLLTYCRTSFPRSLCSEPDSRVSTFKLLDLSITYVAGRGTAHVCAERKRRTRASALFFCATMHRGRLPKSTYYVNSEGITANIVLDTVVLQRSWPRAPVPSIP